MVIAIWASVHTITNLKEVSMSNTIKLFLSLQEARIIELALRKYLRIGLKNDAYQALADGRLQDYSVIEGGIPDSLSAANDVIGKLSRAKEEALS